MCVHLCSSSWCIVRCAVGKTPARVKRVRYRESAFFLRQRVFRGLGWSRFFPEHNAAPPFARARERASAVNHYLFLCFTLSSGGERNEREGATVQRKGGKKGERERESPREEEEDASVSAARSSNYYGFSGSNSPDGNTTQFTHADCAREDVNSCQSDGPFHLLFFAGAPNRHRGRRWTIIRFSTFSSPVLRPSFPRSFRALVSSLPTFPLNPLRLPMFRGFQPWFCIYPRYIYPRSKQKSNLSIDCGLPFI